MTSFCAEMTLLNQVVANGLRALPVANHSTKQVFTVGMNMIVLSQGRAESSNLVKICPPPPDVLYCIGWEFFTYPEVGDYTVLIKPW
jgi:hypothetical protein